MACDRRVHDTRPVGICRLMASLDSDMSIWIRCERAITVSIEIVKAAAEVNLYLPDVDLILPEACMDAIGLVGLANDRK